MGTYRFLGRIRHPLDHQRPVTDYYEGCAFSYVHHVSAAADKSRARETRGSMFDQECHNWADEKIGKLLAGSVGA
ncbi:hypothetical protein PoB_002006800 [Plakobranchus ocellatus]|uniref:Uncharacterized protein n=1 Tax=Plakobranchus ocellatus TaxID=259542 RepID=A0AAV3ZGI4_9GAST|nr:hypothetical protein PoB_002006800 [Plakobranchus ocellatus]